MQVVDQTIANAELKKMASKMFGDLVKAVIDLEKEIMIVDAEFHADEEQYLIEHGSHQSQLWGINLYPDRFGQQDFIQFDSMINLRPHDNNPTRGVSDPAIRAKIKNIVSQLIKP